MYPAPQPASPLPKIVGVAVGALLALLTLGAMVSLESEAGSVESTGIDYGVSQSGSAPGDTQFYDGGSITTTDDGELIYSDTTGNGFSSGN